MAFDFPNAPTNGTTYTPAGGPSYVWSNGVWLQQAGVTAAMKTARTRNRVINPTAQVSQELGTATTTTNGAYPADQWILLFGGIAGAAQKATVTASPEGTTSYVVFSAASAKGSLAAGDYELLQALIEGLDVVDLQWGTPQAKPVVLRFCANCGLAGTYGITLGNNASDRTWCGSFTIAASNVPQVFSFAIPGDTTGTWVKDTGLGLRIRFGFAFGTTYNGVAGWQAGNFFGPAGCTNGASQTTYSLCITDVGLYSDPDATGVAPRFEAPSYEDDLQRCMRYWEKTDVVMYGGYYTSANFAGCPWAFKVAKRAVPSMFWASGTSANRQAAATHGVSVLNDANSTAIIYVNSTANARLI